MEKKIPFSSFSSTFIKLSGDDQKLLAIFEWGIFSEWNLSFAQDIDFHFLFQKVVSTILCVDVAFVSTSLILEKELK